ncbi:MAG: hypothetical protein ACT4NU_13060 [Chromatiales bacterium]
MTIIAAIEDFVVIAKNLTLSACPPVIFAPLSMLRLLSSQYLVLAFAAPRPGAHPP